MIGLKSYMVQSMIGLESYMVQSMVSMVEEYLVISSVYALIDYIILIFFWWLQAGHTYGSRLIIDWTIYGPEYGQAGTINFAFLWFQADHRLDHICPEYG